MTGPRRPAGWLVPALCLLFAGALLWEARADLAFELSLSPPVDLGSAGHYDLRGAKADRFARVVGTPGSARVTYRRALRDRELRPLLGTPIVLERPAGASAAAPVAAEGRLLRDDRAPRYREVVAEFLRRDQLAAPSREAGTAHVWILLDGERPWRPSLVLLWVVLLFGLVAFNAGWLAHRLLR